MFRKWMCGILGIMFSVVITAQISDSSAPASDEYQHYLDHPEDYQNGYIPHPLRLSFLKDSLKSSIMFPEVFDLRNVEGESFVTPIRNQGVYGTCWAFAATASVESYWLSVDENPLQLSVRNMVNCHGFEWGPNVGGNSFLASAYLTRQSGPVLESADKYTNMGVEGCIDFPNKNMPALVSRYVVTGGIEMTKYMIYKHGAVATSMASLNFYNFFDSDKNTFYYQGTQNVDHGVTIVGWNDTMTVENSLAGNPINPGVWIVKNSWGDNFGENGYFYVSYEDKYVGKQVTLYPERLETNEVDTLYMYDYLGAVSAHGFPEAADRNVGYGIVKYTAEYAQIINRVGTYVASGGTTMDFIIARGWDGIELYDTVATVENQLCRFPGYYSVEMSAPVDVGDFYVLVRYQTPGNPHPVPVETKEAGFAEPFIEPVGKQWVSANGIEWDDFGAAANKDLCIRAYAKRDLGVTALFVADKSVYCLGMPSEFTNQSVGVADSFLWLIKDEISYDTLTTYSINEKASYTFSSSGFKSIELIAMSAEDSDTLLRSNYVEVIEQAEVYLSINGDKTKVARGKPVTLTAFGADDYLWAETKDLPESVGSVINFSPYEAEQWIKVKGFLGDCEAEDSLLITTVEVMYDDVADALELQLNKLSGPYTNAYATVELNEPAPEEGDCDTQSTWCVEGGLHNTIWFKFVAPISEEVVIYTIGFDNQIALYDATLTGNFDDILSGNDANYTILAANDDAHSGDFSAEIDKIGGLTAGKTYWIQVDGSAGGEEGNMFIEVTASLPTLTKFPIAVHPNPFAETMTVDLRGLNKMSASIKIYTMQGSCILAKNISDYQYTINKSDIAPGNYIVEVVAGDEVFRTLFTCTE